MNSTQLRDRVSQLARTDAERALQLARGVPEPWFRAQALAAAARWIEDHRVDAVASESLAAAEACDDNYKRAAASAWPIRALLERGHESLALESLRRARRSALAANPAGSQAEALFGLLQGAWALGRPTRRQLVEDLVEVHGRDSFWRVGRSLVAALEMLSKDDLELAREIARRVSDERCRARALAAIQRDRACGPRNYF